MRDALILIFAMALAFWVGDSWGLKRAPAYVEAQERDDAQTDARMAEIEDAYHALPDRACERIMDIAAERLAEPLVPHDLTDRRR